jgi:hypothetical protein
MLAVVDVVLVVWSVAWVLVGVRVAHEVEGLTRLSDTVVKVGEAVDASGQAIESLASVPIVGDRLDDPAHRIRTAGQSALASGRSSRGSIHNLSPLLGFAIALIPTVPLLGLYLPLRIGAIRDRRALDRLVRTHRGDPRLPRLLAQRALARLPYEDLAAATLDGSEVVATGSTGRLAGAEMARLGVEPDDGRP